MATKQSKEKHISVRVPNGTHSAITIYAKANGLTITQAVEELLEEGLKSKNDPVAKKSDIDKLVAESELTRLALVEAIKNQPIEIQEQKLLEDQSKKSKKSIFKKFFS